MNTDAALAFLPAAELSFTTYDVIPEDYITAARTMSRPEYEALFVTSSTEYQCTVVITITPHRKLNQYKAYYFYS
eukprot:scaffold1608_cov205-Chaetoceros_neogracile.AAC.1